MKNAEKVVGTFRTDGCVWLLFLTMLITPDDTRTMPPTHTHISFTEVQSQCISRITCKNATTDADKTWQQSVRLSAGAHSHVMNAVAYQAAHRVLPQQRQKAIRT